MSGKKTRHIKAKVTQVGEDECVLIWNTVTKKYHWHPTDMYKNNSSLAFHRLLKDIAVNEGVPMQANDHKRFCDQPGRWIHHG